MNESHPHTDPPGKKPRKGAPPTLERMAWLLLFARRLQENPELTAAAFNDELRQTWLDAKAKGGQ